jgi:hypothetical protein
MTEERSKRRYQSLRNTGRAVEAMRQVAEAETQCINPIVMDALTQTLNQEFIERAMQTLNSKLNERGT